MNTILKDSRMFYPLHYLSVCIILLIFTLCQNIRHCKIEGAYDYIIIQFVFLLCIEIHINHTIYCTEIYIDHSRDTPSIISGSTDTHRLHNRRVFNILITITADQRSRMFLLRSCYQKMAVSKRHAEIPFLQLAVPG